MRQFEQSELLPIILGCNSVPSNSPSIVGSMEIADNIPIFNISVVARLCNTTPRILREYGTQGIIRPTKIKGRRMFSGHEIGFIRDIRFYLTDEKMTINGLKEFYRRASCWEIKRCNRKKCPAYGRFDKKCWQVLEGHKQCTPDICPFCPIFIIKTSAKNKPEKPISPLAYSGD
ncbi:MAG: MerR family transcriptional regulator [Planctomycetes bacterium]|nr:MerR family transcriptional regulator [Planctomycetota bacterium]